eukprot:3768401-Amphidinium_carterae.1
MVLEAVEKQRLALHWAADELLEDSSFASVSKRSFHILRISVMSGRQSLVLCSGTENLRTEEALQRCCRRLGVGSTGSMCLVSGDDVVPARALVHDWPGIRACGEISEYQLVLQMS